MSTAGLPHTNAQPARPLDGRVAIVTGASSGIGEATAVALAQAGAAVVLAARRKERIASLAERLEGEGAETLPIPVDLVDQSAVFRLVERATERFGRLDILVNNAGVMLLGPVLGADLSDWRRMVDVNLLGLLYCTAAAAPVMVEQRSGHIVNVASTAGRTAQRGMAVYNSTKWGVVGFSEALRQEMLHANVRVTLVEPGFVDTELQSHNTNPLVVESLDRYRQQVGTVLAPADVAAEILHVVSRPEHVSVNEVLIRPTRQEQ